MYHIGKDKRRVQSAAMICRSFMQLLFDMPYETITITEIASCAGVGRATFYRLFNDKADVILYQLEGILHPLIDELPPAPESTDINRMLHAILRALLQNRNLLLALIKAGVYHETQIAIAGMLKTQYSFMANQVSWDARSWNYLIEMRVAMWFSALRLAASEYPMDDADEIINTMQRLDLL